MVDLIDTTGSGDVDTSTVQRTEGREGREVEGVTGEGEGGGVIGEGEGRDGGVTGEG